MCNQKYFKLVTKLHFQGDGNVGPLFIKNTSYSHTKLSCLQHNTLAQVSIPNR